MTMNLKGALMVALLAGSVSAQELDFEAVLQAGADVVDQGLKQFGYEVDRELLESLPRGEDLLRFWNSVERTLNEGSLEDLAWLKPEVESTLSYVEQWPAATPYAEWLRQQLDYFAVAEEVVAAEPELRHRPQPTRKPPPLILPAPAVTTAAPAKAKSRAAARSRTDEVWRKRIKDRPLPKNADRLIPIIKEVFREEGVPEALVWLAEVESTLNPEARNPIGAAGLFQFMPPTAKRFGLRTGRPDERMDPEKSAGAAARYLHFLHGRFGSWPLAVAAYNAGEGRVGRNLASVQQKTFEGIADLLPAETQMYVPKVAAVIELREGKQLMVLPAPRPRGLASKSD